MNLRNYKTQDKATHNEPFIYPHKREYRPEKVMEDKNETLNQTNKVFLKNKFNDKIKNEKNHAHLRHLTNTADFS
jgi:hypothetical protein